MSTSVDVKTDALWKRLLSGGSGAIWLATIVLFAITPLVSAGSLSEAAVRGMLPFAAVLAIAAIGQTLVVQQRGLDLSVPGMMAFGAVLVSGLPQWYGWPAPLAVAAAIVLPALVGLINGIVITAFGVMPLVVTLGMNAVLLGTVFAISNGTPAGAPEGLATFAKGYVGVIPHAAIVAVGVAVVAGVIGHRTIVGRRLTAIGVSEPAARALGLRVVLYQTIAYGLAGAAYGIAAVLYTGYVTTPPLFFGDTYLLPTVAAVVLGGTALTGGRAALISTAVAALFLTQFGQLLRAVGWPEPLQLVAQAAVLLVVVLLRAIVPSLVRTLSARRTAAAATA